MTPPRPTPPSPFPLVKRPRRLRYHPHLRTLVRETTLNPHQFIMPVFVHQGKNIKNPIPHMPGIYQFSPDQLLPQLEIYLKHNLKTILLFGIPTHKDATGSKATQATSIVPTTLRLIKKHLPELFIITDCCFCEYTTHGHCGVLHQLADADKTLTVDNDPTLTLLAQQALIHAKAGSDMIAPSAMLDGMVTAIRTRLDEQHFTTLPIMSYAVKYASSLYGPFREAAQSHIHSGDRRSYQMDIANQREALQEAALDSAEGADILMVKPALPYLDIIHSVREKFTLPLAAYQVSGEYAMIKAASQNGALVEADVVHETLTAIKRAGAAMIITYYAYEYLKGF